MLGSERGTGNNGVSISFFLNKGSFALILFIFLATLTLGLVSRPGIKPVPSAVKAWSQTIGLLGNSPLLSNGII